MPSSPPPPTDSGGANGEQTASVPAPAPRPNSNPELDLAKLQSLPAEQQELFLFTFVSAFSRHVLSLSAEDCTAQQMYLKREVFQIIHLAQPAPSRVVRNNLGRCLAHFLGRGDRKLLFETIHDLMGILSAPKAKGDGEPRARQHAAACCLGDVYAAAGDSAIGLHQLVCSTLLKVLKGAQGSAGLRAAVLLAFGKMAGMIRSSLDEAVARDIWKQARSCASGDKGSLVVVSACRCLGSLIRHTPYFDNTSDFDHLKSAIFKAVDFPSSRVRRAAAECLAEALVKGYSESAVGDAVTRLRRAKTKAAKRLSTQPGAVQDEHELPPRSESPGPAKRSHELALSLADIFKTLSGQYVRLSTTNRARAALGICYGRLLQKLDEKTVETNYLRVVEGLAMDLLGHPNITNNRYRLLITRRIVDTIVQDVVGQKILGESGQTNAAKAIVNDVLKNYPQTLKERPEPTKHLLVAAIGALEALIKSLGSAANNFAESCRDGLLQVLQHPSYTVQVYASSCMKTFVLACPQQLLPCLSVCMNSLNRELGQLGSFRQSHRRCVGFAHGLAATLSASPQRPLYGSVDINSRVLTMATNLLKSSGKLELRVSATQIQVAWTLIGGLMSLGPSFVKIHLSQLLLLWKNALPKPLAKDNTSHRNALEASFLAHVRECALGSILAFLQFNSRLLTVDVSKRIATMLQSTSAFLKTLPSKKTAEDLTSRLTPALQQQDLEMMVQRRVLQCYIKLVNLSPAGGSEALLQSNLLTLAISLFADPDNYSPSSLTASIANAASTFETIWDVGDNEGFGVTGLVSGFNIKALPGEQQAGADRPALEIGLGSDETIERLLLSPVCGTLEHDASLLYMSDGADADVPDPPATEVVNMAIQLFAFVFPLTPAKVQESILEQITTFISAGSSQREAGRKAAVSVNVAVALLSTLKVAARETLSSAGDVTSLPVEKLLQEMLRDFVLDADQYVRSIGYSAVGRLCNVCGNAFTNHEIKYLVDTIVGNREPSARAGCAMTLGFIQTKVGGMAAGYHLKTILGILMSLCNDPHPTVHFWALEALALSADAVGLGFAGYVSSTLGMLAQLYVSDTHHDEVASAVSMNLEGELSTPAAVARCIDSLINVLGPDLQDSAKSRELILTLVHQFQGEEDVQVQRASLNCLEHLSLYAPGHVAFADYVRLLQRYLSSDYPELLDAAVDGLYNLMKRNSYDVIEAAQKGFEDQLWTALDASPGHDGIRNVIRNWMRQTCLADTAPWLQRFQAVLKMTRRKADDDGDSSRPGAGKRPAMPDLQDEEVAGFAAAGGAAKDGGAEVPSGSDVEPIRWQVTAFAMDCLNEVFGLISKDVMVNGDSAAQAALQSRMADVVRMAFSASTSGVLEQRIWGLKIIGAVLKMFGKTPDPDFDEAMLLEQYQAQISSALTPAFAADSSPELAAEAVNVCALFVATGIVTDVDRMGRILKTLVGALESFATGSENAGIGELQGLSSNAQVMVKMAVFAAWAELQVASSEQRYLLDVLRPRIGTLAPLWLESLREFARLRFEPDISMTLGPPSLSGSLDTVYAALNRETLLRFYQDSWLRLVDAIASLIEQDSEFVFDALDGKGRGEEGGPAEAAVDAGAAGAANGGQTRSVVSVGINYRDEPVAFFFVLFGIAFEALAAKPGQPDSIASRDQTLEILRALRRIMHPSVSGHAIYREAIFSETMDLLDRLVLTEGLDVQGAIVAIARSLCVAHPAAAAATAARKRDEAAEGEGEELSEDIEQLFELTRIMVLVLSGLLPNLVENSNNNNNNQPQAVRHQMTDEAVSLIKTALNALVDAAEVFPAIIRTDLHACIVHIFATMLATPSCQQVVVPQALPTLRRLVTTMAATSTSTSTTTATPTATTKGKAPSAAHADGGDGGGYSSRGNAQLQGCLRRFLSIYLHAQKREAPTSLACVRSCLLAMTVLFTGGNNWLSPADPPVARFLDEVVDCLSDRMTARIAANCLRSLILVQQQAQTPPTPADLSIARHLLPRLIAFVADTEPADPEGARGLVAHALCLWAGAVGGGEGGGGGQQRAAVAIALVVPALLARAAGEAGGGGGGGGQAVLAETGARLLELAAVDAAAFRSVVAGMSEGQKAFMEGVVAAGRRGGRGGGGAGEEDGGRGQPSIALKMDFGG